jgi:hypothetical protein
MWSRDKSPAADGWQPLEPNQSTRFLRELYHDFFAELKVVPAGSQRANLEAARQSDTEIL